METVAYTPYRSHDLETDHRNRIGSILVISDGKELERWKGEIKKLSESSSEPNFFFEPWVLSAAFTHLQQKESFNLVLTTDDSGQLTGVFPIQESYRFAPLPFSIPGLLNHSHCFLSIPLLKRGAELEAFSSFFRWIDDNRNPIAVEFKNLPEDSIARGTLQEIAARENRQLYRYTSFYRSKEKIQNKQLPLSQKQSKELRRKLKRLQEVGSVAVEVWSNNSENIEEWINDFIELELAGWKGENGTAIAQCESEKRYFRAVITQAAERSQLIALKITCNSEPIAIRFSFTTNNKVFSYKTVFNEEFGRYSPGMLIEMENINYLRTKNDLYEIDSCTEPGHSFFPLFYNDRYELSHYLVSGRSSMSRLFLSGFQVMRRTLKRLQELLRRPAKHPA